MNLRGRLVGIADWKHWDFVALVAGAVPLFTLLVGFYAAFHFGGYRPALIAGASLLYCLGATLAWRRGDSRKIVSGCAMLMIAFVLLLPYFIIRTFLLIACIAGNCI